MRNKVIAIAALFCMIFPTVANAFDVYELDNLPLTREVLVNAAALGKTYNSQCEEVIDGNYNTYSSVSRVCFDFGEWIEIADYDVIFNSVEGDYRIIASDNKSLSVYDVIDKDNMPKKEYRYAAFESLAGECEVSEVRIYTKKDMREVSRKKEVTADSIFRVWAPEYAVDGYNGSGWSCDGGAGYHWLTVDLGKVYQIERIELDPRIGVSNDSYRKNFRILGSMTGDFEKDAFLIAENGNTAFDIGEIYSYDIKPRSARYVKIENTANQYFFIPEFRVMTSCEPKLCDAQIADGRIYAYFSSVISNENTDGVLLYDETAGKYIEGDISVQNDSTLIIDSELLPGHTYTVVAEKGIESSAGYISQQKRYATVKSENKSEFFRLRTIVTSLNKDNNILKITVQGEYKGTIGKVKFAAAEYKDDKMISAASVEDDYSSDTVQPFNSQIEINTTGGNVKLFIWDNSNIKPLTYVANFPEYEIIDRNLYDYGADILPDYESKFAVSNADIKTLKFIGANGHNVFAYMAYPDTVSNEKAPGIILLHSEISDASANWVRIWRDKGYAAISIDLRGRYPDGTLMENGGTDLLSTDCENVRENWFYQSVNNVLIAAEILSKLDVVDENRLGIVGHGASGTVSAAVCSMGKFAYGISVFGGNYAPYYPNELNRTLNEMISDIECPFLWVNSGKDVIYTKEQSEEAFNLAGDNGEIYMDTSLINSQGDNENIEKVYHFAAQQVMP